MKYMQSDLWNDYYAELEPSKRRQMFPEILAQVEDDGLGQLRKDLFDLRHTDPKDPSNEVDLFLWEIVVLPAYKDSMFKKLAKKQMDRTMHNLGFDLAEKYGEKGKTALYWEFRNTAERFLMTCRSSSYGKKFFGFIATDDKDRQLKCTRDIWMMTSLVPRRMGMEKELEVLTEALKDAFFLSDPEAQERYENLEKSEAAQKKRLL